MILSPEPAIANWHTQLRVGYLLLLSSQGKSVDFDPNGVLQETPYNAGIKAFESSDLKIFS